MASIEVLAFDRSRLLSDVTRVVSEHHLNIVASSSQTAPDRVSRMRFDVELADPGHLDSLLSSLKHLDGVFDVDTTRVPVGRGDAHGHRLVRWPHSAHRIKDLERKAKAVLQRSAVLIRSLVGDR